MDLRVVECRPQLGNYFSALQVLELTELSLFRLFRFLRSPTRPPSGLCRRSYDRVPFVLQEWEFHRVWGWDP